MQPPRNYVLSIAGFDPSGGAGVLADCKTFEEHAVYGFGVCSALTVQTDVSFYKVQWLTAAQIIEQIQPLINRFGIAACKVGIIESAETMLEVVQFLKDHHPAMRIVWDPVLKASAGYEFPSNNGLHNLEAILALIDLLTPNYDELQRLQTMTNELLVKDDRAVFCSVLLKGGHRPDAPGVDTLYEPGRSIVIQPGVDKVSPKHGSGCVLSAAITAQLALGRTLKDACRLGKQYTETFLNSNKTMLGYHHLIKYP